MIDQGDVNVPVRKEIGRQVFEEPIVLVDVLGSGPLHGVGLQHVAQKTDHRLVQVVRDRKDTSCKSNRMQRNAIKSQ